MLTATEACLKLNGPQPGILNVIEIERERKGVSTNSRKERGLPAPLKLVLSSKYFACYWQESELLRTSHMGLKTALMNSSELYKPTLIPIYSASLIELSAPLFPLPVEHFTALLHICVGNSGRGPC